MNSLEEYLDFYQSLGFAVLPAFHGQKRPSVEWRVFQKKKPTKKQMTTWFRGGEHNIAVICGEPSLNLVVLDFDDMSVYPKFFDTPSLENETIVVKTGSGKRHVYLRTDKPVKSFKIPQLGLEIRSRGNIVIAPPSLHPNGKQYEFLKPGVKTIITIPDLEESVWKKAEKLGVPKPHDFFLEHSEATQGQPYTGRTPPCILKLCQGVKEGVRNEAGMRLASYWLKFKQDATPSQVLKRLKQWNHLNKPTLTENELKSIVDSASKLDRSYGCAQNQAWCNVEKCSLKLRQLLNAEAEEEAERILNSSNVLDELQPHLDNLMVGEDNNKKLLFILLCSGIIEDPSLKQMILLKAEAGAGKSHLMRLADAFRTKSVGRFTAHGLDYSDLWNYQVLRLKEIGKMDLEFQGVSTIKFLSADDQGYIVEMPVRGEDGRFSNVEYHIPPITVITSTTRVDMDPQFERRSWILNPDESQDQTRKIAKWKGKHEREKDLVVLGIEKTTSYDKSTRILQAITAKLQSVKVLLPFSQAVTDMVGHSRLRLRGDYDKFFALIRLYGFLHQRTLPTLVNAKGEHSVIVTPAKALEILTIAEEPYQTMASGLEKRTRELIDKLEEIKLTQTGDVVTLDDRGKIAVKLGKSEKTIYSYFKDWAKHGFMMEKETKGKGNPIHFILLYDLDTIRRKRVVTFAISENVEEKLMPFVKEAENTLSSFPKSVSYGRGWNREKVFNAVRSLPQISNFGKRDKPKTQPLGEKEQMTSAFSKKAEMESLPSQMRGYAAFAALKKDAVKTPNIVSITALDEPDYGTCCTCNRLAVLPHQIEDYEGNWGLVCQDCGAAIIGKLRNGSLSNKYVKCPKCGAETPEAAAFCRECGWRLPTSYG